jgi:uncharacterized protein (DUF305 family)
MKLVRIVVMIALAAPLMANEVDRNFVDAMILHHTHGMKMAEMAERKAESPELRRLGAEMVAKQRKENQELEAIRTEGNRQRPELADMPGMSGMNMAWLEQKTGREFDRAFAIAMIDHHLGAIKLADHEIRRGSLAAPKNMARKIRAEQRKDVGKLARFK